MVVRLANRMFWLFALGLIGMSAVAWMRSSQRRDQVHIRTPLIRLILHSDGGRLLLFGTCDTTDRFAPIFVSCGSGEVPTSMIHPIKPKSKMAKGNVSTTALLAWNRPLQFGPGKFVRASSGLGLFQGWGVYLPHWLVILFLVAIGWFMRIARQFTLLHGLLFITYICVIISLACRS